MDCFEIESWPVVGEFQPPHRERRTKEGWQPTRQRQINQFSPDEADAEKGETTHSDHYDGILGANVHGLIKVRSIRNNPNHCHWDKADARKEKDLVPDI